MKHLSTHTTDQTILEAYNDIFLKPRNMVYSLDCTYSKGVMWRGLESIHPKFCSDLLPQHDFVEELSSTDLHLKFESLDSIVFDPPFLFRNRKSDNKDKISARFSYFKSYEELKEMYSNSLKSFYKTIKKGGYVFFKCQDMTDNKFFPSHVFIISKATEIGFELKDIGIKISKSKLQRDAVQQNCLAKTHSYWIVLKK